MIADPAQRPYPDPGTVAAPLLARLGRERCVRVGGVHAGALGYLVAGLASGGRAVVAVVADARVADALALDVDAFASRAPLPFPAWPHGPGDDVPDPEVVSARVAALEALLDARRAGPRVAGPRVAAAEGPGPVIVAPAAALASDVPPPVVVEHAHYVLELGSRHETGSLLEHLALSGYARVGAVETPGEFAARGGVVDVFPYGARTPVRLDFFGDTLESLRTLDPATGRVAGAVDRVRLLCLAPERLREPAVDAGPASLFDYLPSDGLPSDGLVVLVEPPVVAARLAVGKGLASSADRVRWRRLDAAVAGALRVEVSALRLGRECDLDLEVGPLDEVRGVAARAERGARERKGAEGRPPPDPQSVVADVLRRLAARVGQVVVLRRAPGEEERLRELLPDVPLAFVEGTLSGSFSMPALGVAFVAYDDLGGLALRERRPRAVAAASRPLQDFLELEVGEPVVHLHHGIGVFRGLSRAPGAPPGSARGSTQGETQALKIEFAEGTTLFVPVSRIDLVQRYVGTGKRPRLSKIGTPEWAAKKAKVEAAVLRFAQGLVEVAAQRSRRSGAPLLPHPAWQAEFERSFPWKDTPDQVTATAAIKADLAGPRPMDRLLCGDVGFGKTELALRAAFLVASAGRQVAVLVPTTVLCEQHRRTFEARLAAYPVVVRALSRFRTPAEQREILAGLADGSVDVVVGTHRLLSSDVKFRDLAMVVVDEEQRFGVAHKERLKALRADVDVLTMSATPIPRTLHMALLGIRDISNLTTPPPGRRPIETRLSRFDEALVRDALARELERGGQVYWLHNRVFDLPVVVGRVQRMVPDARVTSIHGQMDRDLVEERMLAFVRGDVDVLVATTIVESGLDIPNANTMVIDDAERYGLAELHQLRGRVGREQRHAHCLLLVDPDRSLSEEAARRLAALEEYSELGAGFRIAMRDLELRGAGNLLGAEQSGHLAAVGYDLYCRMLADAVRTVRHDAPRLLDPATVDLDLPAAIPPAWVADARETFRLFRRISTAASLDVLAEQHDDLEARFGPVPPEAERLFLHRRARLVLGGIGVARVLPAEAGGLVLEVRAGADARARLSACGADVRPMPEPGRVYVPPAVARLAPPTGWEGARGAVDAGALAGVLEATLRGLLAALESGPRGGAPPTPSPAVASRRGDRGAGDPAGVGPTQGPARGPAHGGPRVGPERGGSPQGPAKGPPRPPDRRPDGPSAGAPPRVSSRP